MTILNTLNFVSFSAACNSDPIVARRRKLIAKIEEQIQLANDPNYLPIKTKWITDADGHQRKIDVPKRIKRWWTKSINGQINLVVRYGSKPLEFSKGKNAIELVDENAVAETLVKIKEAAEKGELDTLIEQQVQFGRAIRKKTVAQS
ncbi:hypothetical protein XMG59_002384 [Marinobacterium sp. xm-g-59]|uniref:DUF6641 family protein n=1 Tax=Marinobacterium sp. xm-g-59 TaxID=2497748 RepID=UPI00156A5A8B|nr:DUF6641 family protein [Marinobacterium sp. xm-g-59]NRP96260.1 hypothetical protein [Marinobacterium sp. xm-g-59]